ncbi:DUF1273 domain-containing protein [Bacillus rubiinfantis]|uniref:DUF1273 domain-containing protein n=1 Tax=Bacillus rubiinfantis TaxID=1499680 RepID=UPI0009E4F83A|nr:DUF1273 domain-containing protein [Bacillus rubiinfantis]
MKVLTVSGYKPFELGIFNHDHPSVRFIKLALKQALLTKIDEGLEWVLISGQLGVELWAAEVVFELQRQFPELKLAVITPFLHQEDKWKEVNQEWYQSILAQADFVDSITKKGYENPWQFRIKNQYFLEKSDGLLLIYDQEKDGSPKYLYDLAVTYQKQHPFTIELITFYDLQMAVEEDQLNQTDY